MRDNPRPYPSLSSRSAPYRKPRSSGATSPARSARRPDDASRQARGQMVSPRIPDRAPNPHHDGAQPACAPSSSDGERRPSSGTGGNCAVSRARGQADESAREWPADAASTLSIHANAPGPSLRLPLSSAPPTTTSFASKSKARSPTPGSVTTFLRSIELPDKPASAPALQTSFVLAPPSLRLPPVSTLNTNIPSNTNNEGFQVSLVYKGYPFTYDLSALPDDPKGTIALLTITKSDPGLYLLVGAHYRRTGRSRAACAVIRSLLDNLDDPLDAENAEGNAVSVPVSDTYTGSLRPRLIGQTPPEIRDTAKRPAMLLLAACEMDISRERPSDPQNASHVSIAHGLFRAVYGTVNDAIIAEAVRPQLDNMLGLDFPSNGKHSVSDLNGRLRSGASQLEESRARVKHLENELSASRAAQKRLQEKLRMSNDRLMHAEDKMYALESRSRDMRVQLDASRNENWELRHRLTESEERAREMAQWAPSAESRVWESLKDLLFDNLGGGMRGE